MARIPIFADMSSPKNKLFLLDAYALIYRAHFAFTKNPRINSKGMNTSVIFGFTNTLLEVLTKQKPTHIAVAFDTAAATFRDELFEDYKATRQETPEDIRSGIPIVKEIIRGFNIPILEMDGFEADDIIGTIAKKAAANGFEVFMMTPDKDFGQIVDENIKLYKPAYMGNSVDILGTKEVCEKWDIANVSQVIDMLGLQGDTSDNIPGIPGVGPKTAAELLKQFGTVENVVAHAGELKGKLKERVEQYGDQAILSKKLATIVTDVPVPYDEEQLAYKGPNKEVLTPIFEEMEFKTMMARAFASTGSAPATSTLVASDPQGSQLSMFGGDGPVREKKQAVGRRAAISKGEKESLIEKWKKSREIAIEVLTNGEEHFDFEITGVVFSANQGESHFSEASQLKDFSEILEDEKIVKVGHNIKASILALKKAGMTLKGPVFDTMLAHYLIEPEASHDLGIIAGQYLDIQLSTEKEDRELAMERVDIALQLRPKLQKELEVRRHAIIPKSCEASGSIR